MIYRALRKGRLNSFRSRLHRRPFAGRRAETAWRSTTIDRSYRRTSSRRQLPTPEPCHEPEGLPVAWQTAVAMPEADILEEPKPAPSSAALFAELTGAPAPALAPISGRAPSMWETPEPHNLPAEAPREVSA